MSKQHHTGKRTMKITVPTPPPVPHPALIPGIGVEQTGLSFRTNWLVFSVTVVLTLSVIVWAFAAPDSVGAVGAASLAWVSGNFGWLFGALAILVALFMLVIGFGPTGGIRLGADDEQPEFSMGSWISMLFAAGLGIGLLFYGPLEPLTYFLDPAPGVAAPAGSTEAALPALAQTILHWGPIAWAFYALVGGAIAYSTYRRGRPPLISALFEPVFPGGGNRLLGRIIDVFAIIVTLFGTAVSLGIGALQIESGFRIVTGLGDLGNTFLIGALAVLTACFIASAVSGVKRGIRRLSNLNMMFTGALELFVLVVGPTVFLLNFLPSAVVEYFQELLFMLARNPNEGPETAEFLAQWTTYYWAWWVSWTPFVGMFIAKISRGRKLREFVVTVMLVPSAIVIAWFVVYGGTAISMSLSGEELSTGGSGEEVLFEVLQRLPFGMITSVVAMFAVLIFFVTAADSASIVMASMSQGGRPEPSKWVTIVWGLLLSLIAVALLLAGGRDTLGGLQSLMVVSALPFAFVVIGVMISWAKDLRTDPYIIRQRYARAAIAQGVRRGIDEYGDDFVFGASEVPAHEGAGADFDSADPALTDWYVDATTGPIQHVAREGGEIAPGRSSRAIEEAERNSAEEQALPPGRDPLPELTPGTDGAASSASAARDASPPQR
ncbi:BCCT family transporter [Leucobacter massiliensis]|uniref:Choline transporter n=1 Tax=Leucobacter massiliensis TaxID=1686285 RepID=A0A2S9QQZ3_9MICO|nr:BCCT family transporter [Leucobacter massiliensis]PRI11998.1 choline transporter [Leucobacter massiliensis]